MSKDKKRTAISPTREENYPEWYQQVIKEADLAENSVVRGCMVIKPWGYGIWENIQRALDREFKRTGHVNAYFPMLIPVSFLEKEAEHVDGFAKECAVVTHHRLEQSADGNKLIPKGELEEPYVIRPTSETIIGASYAKWVQSYRDLPLLINQWANVMRWEMRTRLFLRTAEFLWQEGHTVHATSQEAEDETLKMLHVYADFAREYMAMPVIPGRKTPEERFPGAVETYTIEAMMQDKKALQAGTSHFLGQRFAKASDIKFQNPKGEIEYAWTTSWGVSTRLIGGLIMSHSDDNGFVIPPRLAAKHVVIMPIYRTEEERSSVLEFCHSLASELRAKNYYNEPLGVDIDDRDIRGGDKKWQNIKKGYPVTIEIGPRDIDKNSLFVGRRDKDPKDKESIDKDLFIAEVCNILDSIHDNLYARAEERLHQSTCFMESKDELVSYFKENKDAGFVKAYWDMSPDVLPLFKELKISARCIPLDEEDNKGTCIFSGKKDQPLVVFGRSY